MTKSPEVIFTQGSHVGTELIDRTHPLRVSKVIEKAEGDIRGRIIETAAHQQMDVIWQYSSLT